MIANTNKNMLRKILSVRKFVACLITSYYYLAYPMMMRWWAVSRVNQVHRQHSAHIQERIDRYEQCTRPQTQWLVGKGFILGDAEIVYTWGPTHFASHECVPIRRQPEKIGLHRGLHLKCPTWELFSSLIHTVRQARRLQNDLFSLAVTRFGVEFLPSQHRP